MMIIFTEGTSLSRTIIEDYSVEILSRVDMQKEIQAKGLVKKYCNCLRLPEDLLRRFEIVKSVIV